MSSELAESADMSRDQLETEVRELRRLVDDLEERVSQIEDAKAAEPSFSWDGESPASLKVEHPVAGFQFPLGNAATSLTGPLEEDELQQLQDDVEALKRGEVDELDLVAGADAEYPIENDIAKLGTDRLEGDLSANEKRAAVIFRKFGGRAESWSGAMTLDSNQARTILEEQRGEKSLNNNTVVRAMRMCAKKTSSRPKGERDPESTEDNLLWVARGDKRLKLKADRDEFMSYLAEVEERF